MKTFVFINAKCEKAFLNKSNPREVKWTQVYRRIHKKGTSHEVHKKKARKVVKVQRDIVGATLDQIKQKRAQRPEIRAAAKEAALKYMIHPLLDGEPHDPNQFVSIFSREIKERQKKKEEAKKKAAAAAAPAKSSKKAAAPKVKAAKAPKAPKGQKGR